MSINQNLRQLRLDKGMTQEQVAEQIGVTRQALSSYESGRTRPDIDMLLRLSEVYGTDLDGILYGRSKTLQAMKRIKITAWIVFALVSGLTAVSSACLWIANRFFAIEPGQMTAEKMAVFAVRQKLTGAWELLDGILLTIALIGAILLLIFLQTGKSVVSAKSKFGYVALFSAATLAIAAVFGFTDPLFSPINYLITPFLVIGRLVFFLLIDLVCSCFLRKNTL